MRDNYFEKTLTEGPSKEGKGWYRGPCPLLLNGVGRQNSTFHMAMASRIVGMDLTPHMFRRLHCTVLAHHQDERVSSAQPQVCGQSASIFEAFYNLNSKSDAQTMMNIISDLSSSAAESIPLDERLKIESQQRLDEELERIRAIGEEARNTEEVIDTQSFRNPIMKNQLIALLTLGTRLDKELIVSHPSFKDSDRSVLEARRHTKEDWKKHVARLATKTTEEGEELRGVLLDIFKGRESATKHKWSLRETMEKRIADAKSKDKYDPQLSDPLWILLDSVFSSVASKLRNDQTVVDYKNCNCNKLDLPSPCVHCKAPLCDRCSR